MIIKVTKKQITQYYEAPCITTQFRDNNELWIALEGKETLILKPQTVVYIMENGKTIDTITHINPDYNDN